MVVLLICSSSLFMAYLDSTILNIALPTLQADLHASLSGLQWVADAYLLVLASLLLLSGSLADRFGRRRLFTLGLFGFSLGSLLCSLAPNTGSLVALRMLQALGGSMLVPVSLSIVRNTFTDARERARALGIWSGIFGLAAACGPVVGGVLVSEVGWRSVFWVNVPIGVAMMLAARRYVPESRAPRPRRLDVPGQLLMIAALGTLTYAVIQGPDYGWGSVRILTLFATSAAAFAAFVTVERRRADPLLELRFFRSVPFCGASVIAVLSFIVLAGFLFVITLYLQQVRGYSPLGAGLALLPAMAVMALAAPVAGALTGWRGPRIPLVASGAAIAAGGAALLGLSPATSYPWLALAMAVLGAGLGLVNPPITDTGVSGMPPSQAGVASAVISVTRQFGSVLGVAVMGAMLTASLHAGLAAGSPRPQAFSAATHGPWLLTVACGLLVAVTGLVTTSARARATARAVTDLLLVLGQRPGQPEPRQEAVVEEPGDARDPVTVEGEHDQPVRVRDRRLPVGDVTAERRLAVRPDRDEPEPAGAAAEGDHRQQVRRGVASPVAEGQRRHRQPGVVGQHGNQRADVAVLERVGEPREQVTLGGRAGQRRPAEPARGQLPGQRRPRPLQGAVDRVQAAPEDCGRLGRAEAQRVPQHQRRPLPRRQVLQRRDEGERDRLPGLVARLGAGRGVGQLVEQHVRVGLKPQRLVGRGRLRQRRQLAHLSRHPRRAVRAADPPL
jgi:EmrB/QacA subfamily drug resistance transporter